MTYFVRVCDSIRCRACIIFAILFIVSTISPLLAESAPVSAGGGSQVAVSAPLSPDETSLAIGDTAGASQKHRPSSFWALFRTILALIVVAAAVYGVVYAIKRFSKPAAETKNPYLKVLASAHLGSNRFVHVVSLGEKAWLIGASDGGVSLIDTVEDKETVDALLLDDSRHASTTLNAWDFKSLVTRLAGSKLSGGDQPNADKLRKQRERLRGL